MDENLPVGYAYGYKPLTINVKEAFVNKEQ